MENKTIGGFIAALRKSKGMTQQDLATKLMVSNKTVSKWECGENYPDISLIPIISEILEVSCDELLKGDRIFEEREKPNKKIEKQMKYMMDRLNTKFKLFSLLNIIFIIIGVLANLILSYSAMRPDIGFFVMIAVFVACAMLEVIYLINLNSKFNDEFFETVNLKNIETVKNNYSFAVFFLIFFLIFKSLPLILTRFFAHGDFIPTKSVLEFGEYLRLLPFFLIIPIISFSPLYTLYTTKKPPIFEFIQIGLIACTFFLGFCNLYFWETNFYLNMIPISVFSALIIVIGTIFLLKKQKNILLISARNLIFLFCPLIGITFFINCALIITTMAVYLFIKTK